MTAKRLSPEGLPCPLKANFRFEKSATYIKIETAPDKSIKNEFKLCNKEKAYRWHHRTEKLIDSFKHLPPITNGEIERLLRAFLKDNIRSGAPLVYSPEQQCGIVAMATEKPRKYGIEADTWTHYELAIVANRDGITTSISRSTVGRILSEANIKPQRSKYWEFPNIEKW